MQKIGKKIDESHCHLLILPNETYTIDRNGFIHPRPDPV